MTIRSISIKGPIAGTAARGVLRGRAATRRSTQAKAPGTRKVRCGQAIPAYQQEDGTVLDYQPNMVLSTEEYSVVGTRPIRHDGPDKVMGRARYSADIHLPGMLHGKILRSPHAHARIRSIDPSRALALPGVKAVVTSADLPDVSAEVADQEEGATVNYGFYSRNVMAREKALYQGHAVAAVAATSPHMAEEALALLDVDYEVLSPVLNALDAMEDGAPILHDRLLTMSSPAMRSGGWGNVEDGLQTNIANRFEFRMGDVEQGFKEAELVLEQEYHTKPVHQGYIEPHSATAQWNADDTVTIWASSQGHFALRDHTSTLLGLPVSKVKIIPMEIGGGFGGKGQGGCYLEPVAAALAESLDKPFPWAVGFFFGNTELSMELWTVIAGISGLDDY